MEEKIKEWIIMSSRLKDIKESEMELRKDICDTILAGKIKGTKSSTFGVYTMTATAKLNGKLDKELLQSMWSDLSEEEKACFKFDPKLIDKEYNKLDSKSNVHRAIEMNPGAPNLKIKSIKE